MQDCSNSNLTYWSYCSLVLSPVIIFIQENTFEIFICKMPCICWDLNMLISWGYSQEKSQWGRQEDCGNGEVVLTVGGFVCLWNNPTYLSCLLARSFHFMVSRLKYSYIMIFLSIVLFYSLFCASLPRDKLMVTDLTNKDIDIAEYLYCSSTTCKTTPCYGPFMKLYLIIFCEVAQNNAYEIQPLSPDSVIIIQLLYKHLVYSGSINSNGSGNKVFW